ncbi:MAG: hypothetical protein RLZZ283_750 [Candidatus Parcubacteria bacterium]
MKSLKATIFNTKGKDVGEFNLPEAVFGVSKNSALVHQIVTAMEANARTPVANTKNRAEVSGGGRKPWAQKGTGRARHGSTRSPIWRHGGVAHGPLKAKNYSQKITKSMAAKALAVVLSGKLSEGRVMLVDSMDLKEPKTKDARALLTGLGTAKGYGEVATRRKHAALIVVEKKSPAMKKSFSNMGNVLVEEVRNINPVEILKYRYLVLVSPDEVVGTLTTRVQK